MMSRISLILFISLLLMAEVTGQSWLQRGTDMYGGTNDMQGDVLSLSADGKENLMPVKTGLKKVHKGTEAIAVSALCELFYELTSGVYHQEFAYHHLGI